MFKYIYTSLILIIFTAGLACADVLQKGEQFPDIELNGELSKSQQEYLGLKGKGPWKLSDINTDFLIIEIFSMYCPHCQKEAPAVNELYEILRNQKTGNNMKIIGIGAGNSGFEVDYFRQKLKAEFPLFEDPDLLAHKLTGNPGTPHFFLLSRSGKESVILYSHAGRMRKAHDFLAKLKKEAGM